MTGPGAAILGRVHKQLFALRLAMRSRAWPVAAQRTVPVATSVRLSGFFSEALGIGSAADMTAAALAAAGHTVVRDDLRPLHRRLLSRRPELFSDDGDSKIWLIHANPPEAMIALFARDADAWRDLYRIGYWTWESSLAPADWLDAARWFHEIWVPAPSVRDAFADAFAKSPWPEAAKKLRVMPHPVPTLPLHARRTNAFTAVTLFDPRSDVDRKNPTGAIAAWTAAFPAPGDARLIVKSLPQSGGGLSALQSLAVGRPDIAFRCEALSRADTEALIAESDVVISLHRGEGFGLTLAEAMTAGVCVVATGWSGNMAFMTPDNSMPVPYRLVPANPRHNGPQAQWADPDVEAAAHALRRLRDDPDLRMRLAEKARSDIAALHSAWQTPFTGH